MPLDETLDLASEEPRGRSNGDSGVERNPQVTGEATLLKELVAELRALNENIGQLGHLKDLSDQLPRIQSILDEAYPQRPLQQHARPEAGVDQETQDKEGTNEAGESGELAQEPPQQQSPQELEVNRDEAEIGGGGERSTLDHPRRKVGEKVVPEIEAQSDPYHGDTGEDDNNNPSASIDSRRQGEFDTMVALDSKLLPSPESLVSIRQRLEEAVSPCCCHERVTWSAVANDPREAGHHAFQDVVLAVPASLPSASGLMEITLHPTTDAATPRVRGQLEDCREFIKTSWPRHPGESDDERDFSSASGVVTVERGPFWFFRGANHDCLTNFRFYVLSSQHRLLLTTPKWAQCDGKSPQTKVTSIRVPGCHPDFEWWRNSDEEMHIGRLWAFVWHTGNVVTMESAAYILSLRIQFARERGSGVDDRDFACYCAFFAAFLNSWNKAHEWTESNLRHMYPGLNNKVVHYIRFAMRWLCPSKSFLPGTVPGFRLQRESGWLPRTGKRPPVPVTEGRVLFLLLSSNHNPPQFNMVVLSNGGPGLNLHFNILWKHPNLDCKVNIEGMQSIGIMQLVLINLLHIAWYQGWVSLLDEIDDSIKVQAVDVLNADSTEGLLFQGSLAQSKVYFQLLQLLRIIPLWIRETREDLHKLKTSTDASSDLNAYMSRARGIATSKLDESKNIASWNWHHIEDYFAVLEKELLERIETKTNEIRGLRDGIINTNALLEASKSTSMNRYIIIFTVLTIFYLPLGFVTAVFSMDLLHEEELTGMKSQYAATIVAVSVVTYAVAIGLVMFVDRQKIKPLLTGLLVHFHFLGHPLRRPFAKDDSAIEAAAETEDGKTGGPAASGRWATLWASSGLHLRQRRKKDKGKAAAEAPELGIALDAVNATSSTPSSRNGGWSHEASEFHSPTRSNTVTSRTRSSIPDETEYFRHQRTGYSRVGYSADSLEGPREAEQDRSEGGSHTNSPGASVGAD